MLDADCSSGEERRSHGLHHPKTGELTLELLSNPSLEVGSPQVQATWRAACGWS